jgi:hypothetical protein
MSSNSAGADRRRSDAALPQGVAQGENPPVPDDRPFRLSAGITVVLVGFCHGARTPVAMWRVSWRSKTRMQFHGSSALA